MADGITISEVAARTGFTASALRFYEAVGLVTPTRTPAGYRSYDEQAVERLRFLSRGKQLGLSLHQIAELVELWEGDQCEPVAHRLRALLGEKLRATRERVRELTAFAAALEGVRARLEVDPADGPCGDGCPCQVAGPVATGADIACTLTSVEQADRVREWQDVAAEAHEVRKEATVAVLRFRADPALAGRVAALAAAEQACCGFLRFTLRIDTSGTELAVEAPHDAAPLLEALLGVSA